METLTGWIGSINDILWSHVLVAALLGCAVWFTLRTRGVQFRMLREMVRVLGEPSGSAPGGERHVSSFQAFAVSLASRVGTGNLAGVATAIVVGGPGAVFWMWVIALVGAASAFVESTLAQLYKRRGRDSYVGGPAYYMEYGLGKRWMGELFAVLISVTFGFAFNSVQSNTICAAWEGAFGLDPHWIGVGLTALTLLIIFGGIHRIARVSGVIVPVMALGYILLALGIVLFNIRRLPEVLGLILSEAFGWGPVLGGTAGAALMQGIKRGLFSNEAGMGSAPNAAATASVSHPVRQGLVQSLSVYIDTLLICTCSAMMVMVFWVQDPETAMALNGMPLVQMAVNNAVGEVGIHFITFAIFAFAFSSLIGNYFYAETNFRYIFKNTKWGMLIFRVLCLAAIFYGCVNSFDLAWNLADIFMGFMAIINLVAILLLGKWALAALDDYTRQRKEGKDPVFIAASVPGMPACECWTTADLPNFGDNPVEEYIEEAASLDSEGLR